MSTLVLSHFGCKQNAFCCSLYFLLLHLNTTYSIFKIYTPLLAIQCFLKTFQRYGRLCILYLLNISCTNSFLSGHMLSLFCLMGLQMFFFTLFKFWNIFCFLFSLFLFLLPNICLLQWLLYNLFNGSLLCCVHDICPSSTFSNVFHQLVAGSFRVSLFIDLGCPWDLGTGWRGAFGTFMISRPI